MKNYIIKSLSNENQWYLTVITQALLVRVITPPSGDNSSDTTDYHLTTGIITSDGRWDLFGGHDLKMFRKLAVI